MSGKGCKLVDLAEKNGRILMLGYILHYHPAIVKLQDLIRKRATSEKSQCLYSNRLNIGKILINKKTFSGVLRRTTSG